MSNAFTDDGGRAAFFAQEDAEIEARFHPSDMHRPEPRDGFDWTAVQTADWADAYDPNDAIQDDSIATAILEDSMVDILNGF